MKHVSVLQGLSYLIRITPMHGGYVIGTLEGDDGIQFESEFPSYQDAYWALMEMDSNEFTEQAITF